MKCEICNGNLVLCPPDFPFNPQFWICEDCESTYIYEVNDV